MFKDIHSKYMWEKDSGIKMVLKIVYLPKLSGELLCIPEGPGKSPGSPRKKG